MPTQITGNQILDSTITTADIANATVKLEDLSAEVIQEIGSASYNGNRDFGGTNAEITTAQFIALLDSYHAFDRGYWVSRGSWDYSKNNIIDFGEHIRLAGATVEVIGTAAAYTIRIHTATTTDSGTGALSTEYIYVNNGVDYAPGWRKIWNNSNDGAGSGLDADKLDGNDASAFEPVIASKGTAFNKSFGLGGDDVAYGNHNHSTVYAPVEHHHHTIHESLTFYLENWSNPGDVNVFKIDTARDQGGINTVDLELYNEVSSSFITLLQFSQNDTDIRVDLKANLYVNNTKILDSSTKVLGNVTVGAPDAAGKIANKKYVDDEISGQMSSTIADLLPLISDAGVIPISVGSAADTQPTRRIAYSTFLTALNDTLNVDGNITVGGANINTLYSGITHSHSYVHDQIASSNTWTITHNLNRYPSVTVVDSADNVVVGDIEYKSLNQLVLVFIGSFSGKAYLN